MKTYTVYMNNTLLCQTIFALQSRVRELNQRPDLDQELLTHTFAALEMLRDVHAGKECPFWADAINKAKKPQA